jgi:hypothetical protein
MDYETDNSKSKELATRVDLDRGIRSVKELPFFKHIQRLKKAIKT